jgi:Dolichyl-phosphate-mannose-protein mannosyltransferase
MSLGLGLSVVSATTLGTLVVQLAWPPTTAPKPWPLVLALGAGLGAGLSATLLFCWMLAFGPTQGFPLAEAGLLSLLAVAALRRRRMETSPHPASGSLERGSRLPRLLIPAFLVVLVAAVAAFASTLRQHPHGEWDAWMNWDLRARMLFRGGEGWRDAFSATFPWSHPDYPPLVPSLVVRSWLYAGSETLMGPALVAGTFTFATVALLAAALANLRSTSQGLLAAMILLSVPFFIQHGTSLYADVPLGFFILATMVFLALDARHGAVTGRFAGLAGVAAGLAVWTKNEGLVFTLATGLALLLIGTGGDWAARRRSLRGFGAGLLPLLLLVAIFKLAFAAPNDLVSTLGVERTLGRITAPDRYYLVAREYTSRIVTFGANGFGSGAWLLMAYLLAFGLGDSGGRRWVKGGACALALLLAIHFMVFVSMADELARLLDSSLNRLLLQLWPAALLLFFMAVRTPEEAGIGHSRTGAPVEDD